MRRLMTLKAARLVVALAVALTVCVAGQPPAAAHVHKVFHGRDFAVVTFNHTEVSLCDEEKDGHWVFAIVRYGVAGLGYMENKNGAHGNCVTRDFPRPVKFIKVCEEKKGCHQGSV